MEQMHRCVEHQSGGEFPSENMDPRHLLCIVALVACCSAGILATPQGYATNPAPPPPSHGNYLGGHGVPAPAPVPVPAPISPPAYPSGHVPPTPGGVPDGHLHPPPPGGIQHSGPGVPGAGGPIKADDPLGLEAFLTPYFSEILETAYFLIDLWHHRTILAGIDRIESELSVVAVKLNQLTSKPAEGGDPADPANPTDPVDPVDPAPFRRVDDRISLFESTKKTAILIKKLIKLLTA